MLNDPITSVCPSLWERYVSEGETETLVNCKMMETSINGSVALSIAKPDTKLISITRWKIKMEPKNHGFQKGISYSKVPFSGSTLIFRGVSLKQRTTKSEPPFEKTKLWLQTCQHLPLGFTWIRHLLKENSCLRFNMSAVSSRIPLCKDQNTCVFHSFLFAVANWLFESMV